MKKTTKPKATATKKKSETKKKDSQSSPIGPNTTIILTIPKAKAKKSYDAALKKLAKKVKTSGFREGKVPPHIAEGKLGQLQIIERALDELVPDIYVEAVKKEKKQPISRPEFNPLELKMGEDWKIEAIFAELPEIKLGKYQTTVKKAHKEGDKKVADAVKNQKKDTKKKSAKESDHSHDGHNHGHDHNHELTDEQKKEMILQNIFRELATSLKPAIPELLLKQETQREFNEVERNLSQMNLTVDQYLEKRGMKFDDLSNELAISVLGRLQLDFILGAIAKEEKIKAEEKDIKEFIAKIEDKRTKEAVTKNPQYQEQLKLTIIRKKVVDFLYDM